MPAPGGDVVDPNDIPAPRGDVDVYLNVNPAAGGDVVDTNDNPSSAHD